MGIDIRLPNIDAKTETEKQIKSYLIQLAEQLQWALQNIDTSNSSVVVAPVSRSLMPSSSGVASPEATFGAIKALIIKSADIVDAYYEEINKKLVGQYVASSAFGTFSETVTHDMSQSATRIENAYSNIQAIETNIQDIDASVDDVKVGIDSSLQAVNGEIEQLDSALDEAKSKLGSDIQDIKNKVEGIEYSIVEVNANINSGLLYYDDKGIPVYGLEVGQRTKVDGVEVFNKYARFTAGRLSFYDQNGTEVAYISDYKLYITNAEITGTLKLGGYLVDTTNGLTFKWVGRG